MRRLVLKHAWGGYGVFSGKSLMDPAVPNGGVQLWFKTTHDCSSAVTGSSVFDFNGDGKAEVIYSDGRLEAVGHPRLRQRHGELGAHAPRLERAHVPHHPRG